MPRKKETNIEEINLSTYDPWITLKKLIGQALIVALVAVLTYFVDIGLPELALEFPEYAATITLVSALIVALLNYLKHKDDSQLVKMDSKTGEIVEILDK